jgi:hypothetical protein
MRSSGRGPASGAVDRLRAGDRKSDRLERADAPAAATVSLPGSLTRVLMAPNSRQFAVASLGATSAVVDRWVFSKGRVLQRVAPGPRGCWWL